MSFIAAVIGIFSVLGAATILMLVFLWGFREGMKTDQQMRGRG